jgi:aminoglycoside 2'-N-acetyltransferase I
MAGRGERLPSPLALQVVKAEDLSAADRAAVLALCSQAYECDFEPFLRTLGDATHVLGRQAGMLVSHAAWVTRWLQSGTLPPMRTAFVVAVATGGAYRGQGFAMAVMQRLAAAIDDFDLGALSPARYGLYLRLGWERWRGPLFIRTAAGLHATPDDEVMILRLPRTPPLDLDASLSAEWREGELW